MSSIRRDAAYVKNPFFCPFCKADEIVVSKPEPFGNVVYQWNRCGTCETEWLDVYELTGYEEVVTDDG
ncbi:MAG: hypothetical protein GY882_03930 [Actinomycetia bacterium]|nr:hypothetical protein [Actinomycetes bacterium]MCP4843679.1 hypothetical protein [Actinomycetes bacterium]